MGKAVKKIGGFVASVALLGVLTSSANPAFAATYEVKTLSDSWMVGDGCSLREAIAAHNALGGGTNECGVFDSVEDKIVFAKGLTGKIALNPALGELVIEAPALTIDGPGAKFLSISGSKAMTILVLAAVAPPRFTLRGVTLREGLGLPDETGFNAQGGAIRTIIDSSVPWAPPSILIEDVVFFNNSCVLVGNSWGAAIRSYGDLVIRRSKVLANQSDFGVIAHDGTLTIEDSELSDNVTNFVAGVVDLAASGPWAVRRCLFRNNSAVTNSYTAIVAVGTGAGVIENSTFTGHVSGTGGVIGSQVPLTIRNSTFYGNRATWTSTQGVVAALASTLTLSSNLFGKHEYPELFEYTAGGAHLVATRNLFSTAQASLPSGLLCASSTTGGANRCGLVASGIGPLGSHGGPTATFSLLPGSPAIDAGENLGGLATDQRGAGFSRTVGVAADIGAYESP